jgi:bifunctional non-homologous end joining protein LigD
VAGRHGAVDPVTDPLARYRARRDFAKTPEPAGSAVRSGKRLRFVVQEHRARRLHYDFRIELDGVLVSWAVPKGPSTEPGELRMAVRTEDHPLSYADFEGVIPPRQYGAGTVAIWDSGEWRPVGDPRDGLERGKLKLELRGRRLRGIWNLIRTRERDHEAGRNWLLVRQRSEPQPDAPAAAPTLPAALPRPDLLVDSAGGIARNELVRYYESASGLILPYLAGRELDAGLDPGNRPLMQIDTVEALLDAVRMGAIEFHVWNARSRSIERPDRLVLDLDPGGGLDWDAVVEGARLTRVLLEELGLTCFVKTSGGKGLHVVVPFAARHGWDAVRELARSLAVHLARTVPQRFVASPGASRRDGRLFVDYLRNDRGATTVAAYSARARTGLPVSMPIAWEALHTLGRSDRWTIRDAAAHVAARGADPWQGLAGSRQSLTPAIERLAAVTAAPKPRSARR